MKPTVVKKWDVKDRGDGIEIRMQFRDGRTEKVSWSNDDAGQLADLIQRLAETDEAERPVMGGTHVR